MKTNRKVGGAAAMRCLPALKMVLVFTLFAGVCIGFVYQKNQLIELGAKIKDKETQLGRLRDANIRLSKQEFVLRSPAYLERRIKELNLPLALPLQAQILRLPEGAVGEMMPGRNLMLAERTPGRAKSTK